MAHIRDVGHREAGAAVAEAMAGLTSPHSVLILLCDGLSGAPHEVVRGAYSVLGAAVPLVGGFAGDDQGFQRTYQFFNETVLADGVIGVALGSDAPIGIGIAHGWHRLDPPMIVTRSSGGRIYELDDEPALDVLLRRNGMDDKRAADLFRGDETLQALGLSRRSGEDIRVLYAGDDEERSIWGTADVPQGALCWVMEGDHESLIDGAVQSCAEALDGLDGKTPLGVLAFDCGVRRGKLGADGMQEEMRAMRTVLGSTPFAGLLHQRRDRPGTRLARHASADARHARLGLSAMFNWSTHQLTEYFSAVNASADEASAIAGAVERAAEMVEAEVGAVVLNDRVLGAWGFGADVPVAGLLRGDRLLAVPGLGELHTASSALGDDIRGALVVARLDEEFDPEERQMLHGMSQVLGLALRSIRVLAAERSLRAEKEREASSARTRQRLVETLLTIQRAISTRRPLPEILDAVTGGAAALLGDATWR